MKTRKYLQHALAFVPALLLAIVLTAAASACQAQTFDSARPSGLDSEAYATFVSIVDDLLGRYDELTQMSDTSRVRVKTLAENTKFFIRLSPDKKRSLIASFLDGLMDSAVVDVYASSQDGLERFMCKGIVLAVDGVPYLLTVWNEVHREAQKGALFFRTHGGNSFRLRAFAERQEGEFVCFRLGWDVVNSQGVVPLVWNDQISEPSKGDRIFAIFIDNQNERQALAHGEVLSEGTSIKTNDRPVFGTSAELQDVTVPNGLAGSPILDERFNVVGYVFGVNAEDARIVVFNSLSENVDYLRSVNCSGDQSLVVPEVDENAANPRRNLPGVTFEHAIAIKRSEPEEEPAAPEVY